MGNRAYKDSIFVDLFLHCENASKNFYSLFLALARFFKIDFQFSIDDLSPVELDSSLYSGGRTDVLYCIGGKLLPFIEHQSTINPNMTVRLLEYFVESLKTFGYEKSKYGSVPIEIPSPIFIVLYNGEKEFPDVESSKLSELVKWKGWEGANIELKVTTININYGHNMELLDDCPILKEYSLFIAEVRKQIALHGTAGFEIAIDICIKQGVLAEYLKKNRRLVMSLFMGEYDQEMALQVARKESYEKGVEKGVERGYRNIAKNLLNMKFPIESISKATGLSAEEIEMLKKEEV